MKLGDRVEAPLPDLPPVSRRWAIRETDQADAIAEQLDVPPLLGRLLANRGVDDPALGKLWLDGSLRDLPDPFGLTDMTLAVERVLAALAGGERICVHGDYDVDGCTSTALLVGFLGDLGGDVTWYAPHRQRDGYGIALHTVDRLAGDGVRLMITCDTGISAHEALERCVELGIDVVVCDHHMLPETLPPAVALLDPKRDGDGNPYEELAAVGMAFMLAIAVRAELRKRAFFSDRAEPDLREWLDVVALGTVADLAPLRGINRLLVTTGLKVMSRRRRPGIAALLDASGVGSDQPLQASHLGFRLGPRINAAGRLDDPGVAVELLLATDYDAARTQADRLDSLNRQRQSVERAIFASALKQCMELPDLHERRGLVLWSDEWHSGVVGIVASRIVSHLHKPTLVIAVKDGVGTGSGRGISGVDLIAVLRRYAPLMQRFGGHRMAAGLTIDAENLPALRDAFAHEAFADDTDDLWLAQLKCDAELPLDSIDDGLWAAMQRLGPYGIGNPEPVFVARDLAATGVRTMAKNGLRMELRQAGASGRPIKAVGFGLGVSLDELRGPLEAAFCLQENHWRGRRSLELRLRSIRPMGAANGAG